MSTSAREHIQGPSADEKERRRLTGIHLTRRAGVVRKFGLSREDQMRMDTLDANDPDIAAYSGYPEIQAQAIKDRQAEQEAAQETARRRAEGSLRAHMPTAALLGIEELVPPPVDMMEPGELPYFGE